MKVGRHAVSLQLNRVRVCYIARPGHVRDPYAPELAEHDSSPSFLLQATYDRDGNEVTAEMIPA